MDRRRIVSMLLCLGLAAPVGLFAQEEAEPDKVRVQHVLISFKGKSGRYIDRSKQEAEALAVQVLERARAGDDFTALVKEFTDDSFPGIYVMANRKVEALAGEEDRYNMAKSFGDVSFSLDVGEVGFAEYHATRSPYGWHIIVRLE